MPDESLEPARPAADDARTSADNARSAATHEAEAALADEAVRALVTRFGLEPHPEGGYFREVYRSRLSLAHPSIADRSASTRCTGTLIYYLLADRQFSAFHRVRWSDEIWHLYAGGPLELHTIDESGRHQELLLTGDFERGAPTAVVVAGHWQAARLAAGSRWAFGGCTVAPGFDFADFEMARAERLIERYPEHESIIRSLTR